MHRLYREKKMDYRQKFSYAFCLAALLGAISLSASTTAAQSKDPALPVVDSITVDKKVVVDKKGRDPFAKYAIERKASKAAVAKLEPPSIQVRIERYRAQKQAAAAAHIAPPKPTTALLLNEVQVTGIFRTPRGWAAMVEATPIHLSYIVYPGEAFFDGQLVAIEESRLVLRRNVLWNDGRHEATVENKPLRQPDPVAAMAATKAAPATAPAPESAKSTPPAKQ
jgi:hypothetical protein